MNTVPAAEIESAFERDGTLNVQCLDRTYALPAADWLADFAESFRQFRERNHLGPYSPEVNDCDKWAKDAWDWSSILHRMTTNVAAGLAFGFVGYPKDAGGAHAINVAVCRDSLGILYPHYWEPQLQQPVELSDNERRMAQIII
jgi:hypothetical protein